MTKEKEIQEEAVDHDEIYGLSNGISRGTIAIIDTVLQRGAFKGEELSTIGNLRDQCIRAVTVCEEYHSSQEEF
jgi:hypothetical protein